MQGNNATFRVGELNGRQGPDGRILDRAPITNRVRELVAALPYAQATDNILGYLWGKEAYGAMMYAGAVSDLSIADSLVDPRWRPLMLGVAREVLAQAPVTAQGFDGFEPDDLEGSLDRLAAFNRHSAKSHSGIYRDLMVRRRKTEVDDIMGELSGPLTTYAGRIIQSIERGERTCEVANLELLAAQERAERIGRQLGAVVDVIPRTTTGPRRSTARGGRGRQRPHRRLGNGARQRQSRSGRPRPGHRRCSGDSPAAGRRCRCVLPDCAIGIRGRGAAPGHPRDA